MVLSCDLYISIFREAKIFNVVNVSCKSFSTRNSSCKSVECICFARSGASSGPSSAAGLRKHNTLHLVQKMWHLRINNRHREGHWWRLTWAAGVVGAGRTYGEGCSFLEFALPRGSAGSYDSKKGSSFCCRPFLGRGPVHLIAVPCTSAPHYLQQFSTVYQAHNACAVWTRLSAFADTRT